ncbi:type I 3-dehydroquinate dehydratase [Bacillus swezeyi]|uniref:3-dehydroquinate dehydratase n=1 Tax=Bacillus swezeyi TaxID=1925020 RepID=A0A1R1RVR2_9BACI|nr:type I 3-dehydroquinate dehydratase [Bacillus swezeyi]MEC1261834.1 type I 3-dehydroquinate dehydratase [Bacillus swezeyi]MED2926303.1 type I 3-dehydroquinate dehydratase [Bacillus swezeyi]MED2966134.1 type I 3-dehydroquinate dehydratase [Bacillus swezeyi]MED3070462.1 type I 3-dehydroquinate dehydratase [Bacillus swezeyi]MED3082122.1 type I 3-dehydroquinate dehydratase [Bacillus swezeyi]
MEKLVKVRGMTFGEGAPKICVPLVGETLGQLKEEAAFLQTLDADVAEWRADFYEGVEDIEKVTEALSEIRGLLKETPLIFTFRSAREGGEKDVSPEYYFSLNETVIKTGLADLIDIELFHDERAVKAAVEAAHANEVAVIISNHDFEKTPAIEEMISRLKKAQELGADLPKIAVMPETPADVLRLLEATYTMHEQYAKRPIITMSMAGKGVVSRLAGEVFGSAMTFGAAKKVSAPGQIAAGELKRMIGVLHDHL